MRFGESRVHVCPYPGECMTTVLIIDDSIDYLHGVSELLDAVGYCVVLTVEPQRALELCHEVDFDLILCALELREHASVGTLSTQVGIRTLLSLLKNNPTVPIVATGALLSEEVLNEMERMGIREALPKHLSHSALLRNISRLIGGATA